MRHLLCLAAVGLMISAAGCRKARPTLAGGKPVRHWVEALQDSDVQARKKAVRKLGNAGAADAAVVPALIGALKDGDAGVRAEAALALVKIGPAAREAVPALTEAREDQDAWVRECATAALEKVQGGK